VRVGFTNCAGDKETRRVQIDDLFLKEMVGFDLTDGF